METTYYRQRALDVLSGRTYYREDMPNPSKLVGSISERFSTYDHLLAYYNNTAFDEVVKWAQYKLRHNLYRFTRNIFNPVKRVVDFYVDHVYPGVLSVDGKELPNGVQSSIPLSHETPKELAHAIAETWLWSRWQSRSGLMVKYGGITGNALVEIVDDPINRQVRYKPIWTGFVPVVKLDDAGNLEAYVLEYQAIDEKGNPYLFGKEVQRDFIAYYKNRQVQNIVPNPYGFIPAEWISHEDSGSVHGEPAVGSSRGKIDEVNSVASHVADHIHKQIDSPRIMWTSGTVKSLFATDDDNVSEGEFDQRRDTLMLKGPKEGSTDTLVGNLDPATIVPVLREMILEIEADFPEITMYAKLREMHQVTGPAATKMMGDVDNKLRRPAANYDLGSSRLFAKGVAMAGFRVRNGDWGTDLTPKQKQFGEFGLDSYNRGELHPTILPRPLVTETTKDVADELYIRAQAVNQVREDIPAAEKFRMLGRREDEIPALVSAWEKEQEQAAKRALELAAASKPPAAPTKPTEKAA
jgi:hypothetical protein